MKTPVPAFQRTLYRVSPQAPHVLQAQLERLTDAVLAAVPGHEADPLRTARFRMGGEHYRLALRLLDVLPEGHLMSLEVDVTADAAGDLAAVARSAASWLAFWTGGDTWHEVRPPGRGAAGALQAVAEAWRQAELKADDVAATQRAIVEAMRRGWTISTTHKEGGTVIRFDGRHFVRADFGESNDRQRFDGEAEFLAFLRRFFDVQTSRHGWPQRVPEAHAWRLIHRQLREPDSPRR